MAREDNKKKALFREKMRDKTVSEFLNDQLKETGITNTGDMLSDVAEYHFDEKSKKNK